MAFGQAVHTAAERLKQAARAVACNLSEPPAGDLPEEDTVFQADAARVRAEARPNVRNEHPDKDASR
jgi:hypothetical protein